MTGETTLNSTGNAMASATDAVTKNTRAYGGSQWRFRTPRIPYAIVAIHRRVDRIRSRPDRGRAPNVGRGAKSCPAKNCESGGRDTRRNLRTVRAVGRRRDLDHSFRRFRTASQRGTRLCRIQRLEHDVHRGTNRAHQRVKCSAKSSAFPLARRKSSAIY